jgi:hypothetical protein
MKLSNKDDLYSKVMERITKVRDQGESPRSDVLSMDSYICDLCKGPADKENIIQCAFCGRWVCRNNCWDQKINACNTCVGVIKLCKDSIEIEIKSKKVELETGRGNKKSTQDKKKFKVKRQIKNNGK